MANDQHSRDEKNAYRDSAHHCCVGASFAHDAAMGDLQGLDVLLEQLRLYSHDFWHSKSIAATDRVRDSYCHGFSRDTERDDD